MLSYDQHFKDYSSFAAYIAEKLMASMSLCIVAPSNAGKTWFVEHTLLPLVRARNMHAVYFADCDHIVPTMADCAIVDEVELLADRAFLEAQFPNDRPYYSDEYLSRVARWHTALARLTIPTVYIVSRPAGPATEFLLHEYCRAEWDGRPIDVYALPARTDAC